MKEFICETEQFELSRRHSYSNFTCTLPQVCAKECAPPTGALICSQKERSSCLAAPSFHDGKGLSASALNAKASSGRVANAMSRIGFIFVASLGRLNVSTGKSRADLIGVGSSRVS
jgi:hypothetical protein